jgi:NAD(P)-dependent dehydrogenase (short-subunit alcohol dehydrogenase family)
MPHADAKTAVVTGGSRGIGRAVVEDLLAAEWRVISISRSATEKRTNHHHMINADLSSPQDLESVIKDVCAITMRVDLLVNNAGAIESPEQLLDVTERSMLSSWRLHTWAPLYLTRELSEALRRAPNPAVVNIGSVYGRVVDPEVIAYGSSKCALEYVTSALALALAPSVRVNLLVPGHVDTRMTHSAPSDFIQRVTARTPLKRIASTEEIVKAVRFLASKDASFITGASLLIDGGFITKFLADDQT